MNKTGIIIAAAAACVAAAGAIVFCVLSSRGYSGTVTAQGEPLANVSVSDGRNVVKTDIDGKFFLNGYRKTRFITVTAPAGYTTEKYYISVENGKNYSYDFELKKSDIAPGEAHSFLQISDTEIGKDGVGEWINYLKDIVKNEQPAFLIHTGDICYEDGLKRHIEDMNTQTMGVPVRYVIGNHDYVEGKYGEELYESLYGPVWYSFEVGNVHYVVTSFQDGSDYKSRYSKNDRWRWLENDLANTDSSMKVIMFSHNAPPNDDYVISFDRKELDLKEHNLIAWAFGHYHYNYIKNNDGILSISTARPDCGGIDSSVSGARLVNIAADGSITSRMVYYDFSEPSAPENTVWSTQLQGNVLFCNTVTDGGRVYTATVDENYPRTCGIYCLDAHSGEILWFYETKNSVKNNVLISGGALFTQDCEGNVYCLDAQSGSLKWTTAVPLGNALNTSSGICLSDGVLYTGCAAAITALKASDGSKVWENIRNCGESSPAEFIVTGNKLIVSSHWDALLALDKTTGKELWKNQDGDIRFRSSTPAILSDGTLIVSDSRAIMEVDTSSGNITNKLTLEDFNFSSSAQPLCIGNTVLIPTADKGIVGYSAETKELVWSAPTGKALIYTAPYTNTDSKTVEPSPIALDDGSVVFPASDGRLYKITADGEILSSVNIGSPVFGSAAVAGDKIIVADFSGRVSCVEMK